MQLLLKVNSMIICFMLTQLESEHSTWEQAQLTPHAPAMESPTSAGLTQSQVWSFSRRLTTSAIAR